MEKSEKKKPVILAIVGLLIIAGIVLTIVLVKHKPDETSNTRSKNDKKATKEDIGLIPPVIVTYNENEDTDGDKMNDPIIVADSGFDVKKDGFSFNN